MNWLNRLLSPLAVLTDEQAMHRVQTRDDHEAFAELVRRWEPAIRRLCGRMTGDPDRAEDMVQETFVRVFAKRHVFIRGRTFSTWLWRIALNLCHDDMRRRRRRGEAPLAEAEGVLDLEQMDVSPGERLVEQERVALVREALMGLPETHRAVLVLREYEGLKVREIAEVLAIPEGTVKSRMADALTQLSRRLKPLLDEESTGRVPAPGPLERRLAL